MASDDVQVARTVYLPGPSAVDAGISSSPVHFPWPLLHATWDVTGIGLVCGGQANNGDRRPVSQPGKACVMQVEGGGGTCGVPLSIRWTGKSGQGRAERMGEGGRKADCPQKERRQSGGPQAVASGQAHGEG